MIVSPCVSDLDVAVHGCGLGSSDQTLQLCTTVVLGLSGQLFDVHINGQQVELFHLLGVNVQDLETALLIGQAWQERDKKLQTLL